MYWGLVLSEGPFEICGLSNSLSLSLPLPPRLPPPTLCDSSSSAYSYITMYKCVYWFKFVCIYIYTSDVFGCMHECVCAYIYIHTYTYKHVYMCVYIYIYIIYIYIYIYVYIYMDGWMYRSMEVYVCVGGCVCAYIYMYIQIAHNDCTTLLFVCSSVA